MDLHGVFNTQSIYINMTDMSEVKTYTLKPSELKAIDGIYKTVEQLNRQIQANDAALQGMLILIRSQQGLSEGEWKLSADRQSLEKVEVEKKSE